MDFLLLIIRLFISAIFAVAGIAKFADLAGSEKAFKEFGVPSAIARPSSIALSVAEILISILLLFPNTSWYAAIAASFLLLLFIGQMIYQLAKGNLPDCHCFGQLHSEPVSKKSLVRNILFGVLTMFVVAQGKTNQGLSLFALDQARLTNLLTIAILALIGIALVYLHRIIREQKLLARRMDLLELIAKDGDGVSRDEAGVPYEGLPIGAPFPEFELTDIDGRSVSVEDLKKTGKSTLLLFLGPNCGPCYSLLPEIEGWQTTLSENLNFLFFSSGTAEENLGKFSGETKKQILLEKDRNVANLAGARWTPTALLVNSNGRIASHLAAGDVGIRGLIERIEKENTDKPFTFFAASNGYGRSPKIGQNIPNFSLTDLKGREVTSQDFKGKETLVAFWSLTCPHCQQMMEEFRDWELSKSEDAPNLILFSNGDREEHESIVLDSPILLDKGYKTAAKFGMFGTPSAVLVDENGIIVTETAIGGPNIWALIGKRKI